MTSRVIGMERKEIEGRDLRKLKDILPMALRACELREKRLGVSFTVADLNRLGVELLYSAEIEMLRAMQEKVVFDVCELPSREL